jgi:hypothetical protein
MDEKIKVPVDENGRRKYVAPDINIPAIGGMFRDRSEGWMCAIRRPVIGMHSFYAERYSNNSDYPHWLLIIDDDTSYNMDIFQYALTNMNPNEVHVLVGYTIPYNWPYGGFGITFSRAAIQRLYTRLYCHQDPSVRNATLTSDLQSYVAAACKKILNESLIFENEEYHDGMSLVDLMLAIQLHRQPFCWHSDWYLGWFSTHYVLLGEGTPVRFPSCSPYDCHPTLTGNCTNSSLVCHKGYQNGPAQSLNASTPV